MIKFPNDFRNSKDFAYVGENEIEIRVNQILEEMKNNDIPQHIMYSGDTLIMVTKLHEEDGGGFEVIVTKDYYQKYVDNKIFS